MRTGKDKTCGRFSQFRWLALLAFFFSSPSWSMNNSDFALLGLMIDGYRLKIEAWSSIDTYSESGPNIDVYPVELDMQQRLFNVDDQGDKLLNAKDEVQAAAQAFALDWQRQGTPSWEYGSNLEASVEHLSDLIQDKISTEGEATLRARQLYLLMTITSVYVFKGNEVASTHDLSSNENVEQMVAELDASLKKNPVADNSFSAKWRFIKPVILKMDFRAPDLVKRHALSMGVILWRSLDEEA